MVKRKGFRGNPCRHSLSGRGIQSAYSFASKNDLPTITDNTTGKEISLLPTPSTKDRDIMPSSVYEAMRKRSGIIPIALQRRGGMDVPPKYLNASLEHFSNKGMSNPEMERLSKKWIVGVKTQRDRAKAIYNEVTPQFNSIYYVKRMKGNLYRFDLSPAKDIWKREKKDEPCHTQSIVLRSFLLASGKFKNNEVKFKTHWMTNVPHIYLSVYLKDEDKWVDLDPWWQDYVEGAQNNPSLAFGKHA